MTQDKITLFWHGAIKTEDDIHEGISERDRECQEEYTLTSFLKEQRYLKTLLDSLQEKNQQMMISQRQVR